MKSIFLFILLLIPTLSFCQKKDTTINKMGGFFQVIITEYFQNTQPKTITYETWDEEMLDQKIELGELTDEVRMEFFMRGLSMPKLTGYFSLDSIKNYFENGDLKFKKFGKPAVEWSYNYGPNGKRSYIEQIIEKESSFLFGLNETLELNTFSIKLEGKIGEQKQVQLLAKNRGQGNLNLSIDAKDPIIVVREKELQLQSGQVEKINIQLEIPTKEYKTTIQISNQLGKIFTIPVSITGYDLDEQSFVAKSLAEEKSHLTEFTNRSTIFIKGDGLEKLLEIYKDEKLLSTTPISKTINEIDIQELRKGEYLFEIVDLGTQKRRSCKVIKK